MESAILVNRHRWKTLEHRGVAFPPEYVQRGIGITILGERLLLNRDQEELIYAWAKKKETHYVKDIVFQSNFLSDLKRLLPEKLKAVAKIEDMDMVEAYTLVEKEVRMKEEEKERLKLLSKEERKKISMAKKAEKEKLKAIFGKAYVDGVDVDVANWLVEPPAIFMGRGQHPLRGRWKPRVKPNDVTLNLGETAHVPEGDWNKVVHDHTSTWLASWIELLTGKRKYVWLHDSASLRQDNDKVKYDRAKLLEKHIGRVTNEIINKMLKSKDDSKRRIATVCYLIFKLAMRVGDEKDPEEADTVGASTVRVEHIKFPRINGALCIEFNFLGKDSVPWQRTLEVNSEETKGLYENLIYFMKSKSDKEEIFEDVNSSKVNAFLRSIDRINMPNLTAKVFRTYVATQVVKESLKNPPIEVNKNTNEARKVYVAKMANLHAAMTCNHKKGVDPNNPAAKKSLEKFEESVGNKRAKIEVLKSELKERKYKTESQGRRAEQRLEKLQLQIKLQEETKDYNLGTSLRNYVDPRVIKAWADYLDLDWTKVYTATLQRKFKWIEQYSKGELRKYLNTVAE
ncbi:MAG: DNA topoisomerase I [Thermoproteota archaeon]|nr:DNA topoisomerase I [Thermoproteota archaeon]